MRIIGQSINFRGPSRPWVWKEKKSASVKLSGTVPANSVPRPLELGRYVRTSPVTYMDEHHCDPHISQRSTDVEMISQLWRPTRALLCQNHWAFTSTKSREQDFLVSSLRERTTRRSPRPRPIKRLYLTQLSHNQEGYLSSSSYFSSKRRIFLVSYATYHALSKCILFISRSFISFTYKQQGCLTVILLLLLFGFRSSMHARANSSESWHSVDPLDQENPVHMADSPLEHLPSSHKISINIRNMSH